MKQRLLRTRLFHRIVETLLTIFIDVSEHMVLFFTAQYCDKLSKKISEDVE